MLENSAKMQNLFKTVDQTYFTRLRQHLRIPLYLNAYALVASAVITSLLGIFYWILAARFYSPETIGMNTAIISAVNLLGHLAQLNLVNALNRFLPVIGKDSRRFIFSTYLLSALLAVITSLVFLASIPYWAPKLAILTSSPLLMASFTLMTIFWVIFVLQDGALTGIRQAFWVPVENTFFAIFKIILLFIFASMLPELGIYASWLVPLGVTVILVSVLLHRVLIPKHIVNTAQRTQETVHPNLVARYVAADFIGSLFWIAIVNLQPILVNEVLGPSANAYFYLPSQFAYALFLVIQNMGMSLVTEVALDPRHLSVYSFHILKQTARLILPAVALLMIGAPYLLMLFGQNYSTEGTTLLRLLSLSAIPRIFIVLHFNIARAKKQISTLIFGQAAYSILTIVLILLLIRPYGVTGIGIAWLVSHSVVALFLVMTSLRKILISNLNLRAPLKVYGAIREIVLKRDDRKQVAIAQRLLPKIRHQMQGKPNAALIEAAISTKIIRTVGDVTVITLAQESQPPTALLKIANSDYAECSLRNHKSVLSALCSDQRLKDWAVYLPQLLLDGEVNGRYYQVEEMLPGIEARLVVQQPEACKQMMESAVSSIIDLHQRTASVTQVNEDLFDQCVGSHLALVRAQYARKASNPAIDQKIDRLANELSHSLLGKTMQVSWVHGDYSPGNILVNSEDQQIEGIIDWDQACARDLPMLDILHLLLSIRILVYKQELGEVIRAFLHGEKLSPHEKALFDRSQAALSGEPLDFKSLVLLSWLRHIGSNLTKSTRYADNWLWFSKNIDRVLEDF